MVKKKEKNIDENSWLYFLIRKYINFALKKIFYRRFTVLKEVDILENIPVVYAANHQNALIDALVIIASTERNVTFFARADLFKSKIMKKALTFLKIAPMYRIRDGRDSLIKNNDSFQLATDILSRNNSIGIFPEGTHNDKEQIIPLKKGLARIVLQTESNYDFKLGVQVVPVSINYLNYVRPRSEVHVQMGKPLTFTHLKDLYYENPPQALLKFNEEFDEALKSIVIHVESEKDYLTIQNLKKTLVYLKLGVGSKLRDSFYAARSFISKINHLEKDDPTYVNELNSVADSYYTKLQEYGITEPFVFKGKQSFFVSASVLFLLVVGLPLFLVGYILNFLPFVFLYRFANRKIGDTQFRSSVYFAATTLFVGPFFYLLQFLIAVFILGTFEFALLLFPIMIVSGIFSYMYFIFSRWAILRWKANIFVRRNKNGCEELQKLHNILIEKLKEKFTI